MPEAIAHARKTIAAVVLLILGFVCCVLFPLLSRSEHHAFSPGASPPDTVHLTAGSSYALSVPGGVKTLLDKGVDLGSLQCEWSVGGSASQALAVTPQSTDTKATNVVATFVAPFTGDLHIDCPSAQRGVFVDNADNSSTDLGGWFLVVGAVLLTVGAGLAVSALRESAEVRSAQRAAGEYDEIEALVDVHGRSVGDDEIDGGDGGDVLT